MVKMINFMYILSRFTLKGTKISLLRCLVSSEIQLTPSVFVLCPPYHTAPAASRNGHSALVTVIPPIARSGHCHLPLWILMINPDPSGAKFCHFMIWSLKRGTLNTEIARFKSWIWWDPESRSCYEIPTAALGPCLSWCSVVERIILFLGAPPVFSQ